MKESSIIISLIFVIQIAAIFSSSNFKINRSQLYLMYPIDFYYNGYYYIRNVIVNPTNNTVNQNNNCSGGIVMTSSNEFYCKGLSSSYSLIQITPDGNQVLSSYPFPNSFYMQGPFISGNFLTLTVEKNNVDFYAFDPNTKEFLCKTPSVSYNIIQQPWYTGEAMIYLTLSSTIVYSQCGQANITTNFSSDLVASNILGFNQSSIFLLSTNNQHFKDIQNVAYVDLTGQFYFGPAYNLTNVEQFNDTHISASQYSENYVDSFLLYTISPNLELQLVSNFTPGIINSVQMQPILGSSSISGFYYSGGFVYDFEAKQISLASSEMTPLIFTNGTVVNLTSYGYFIQNRNQPIKFVPFGIGAYFYQNLTTSYALKFNNQNSNCTLYTFIPSKSYSSVTTFTTCPTGLSSPSFQGVYYDENNSPIILISDTNNNYLYFIRQNGMNFISTLKGLSTYYSASFVLNLTNNTGLFVYLPAGGLYIKKFSVVTGAILQTVSIKIIDSINYNFIILSHEFMLVQFDVNTSYATFEIYSLATLTSINRFSVDFPPTTGSYSKTCIALGTNTTVPFEGLACSFSGAVYMINPEGTITGKIPVGFAIIDLTAISKNSFYIQQAFAYYGNLSIVEVTDWN